MPFSWLIYESAKIKELFMEENYQKVAYIGLRNPDGSYLLNVPLYVKVKDLNKNGLTDTQEELIHRISQIMMNKYEQQINEFMKSKKELKNE